MKDEKQVSIEPEILEVLAEATRYSTKPSVQAASRCARAAIAAPSDGKQRKASEEVSFPASFQAARTAVECIVDARGWISGLSVGHERAKDQLSNAEDVFTALLDMLDGGVVGYVWPGINGKLLDDAENDGVPYYWERRDGSQVEVLIVKLPKEADDGRD